MMVLLSTDTQLLSAGMEKNKTVAEETYCWVNMYDIHLKNLEAEAPYGP